MSRASLFGFVPCALIAAASIGSLAWSPTVVHAPEPASALASDESPLAEAMETMNSAMRSMAKGIDAANRDKSLDNVAKMQTALLVAKLEKPPEAAKVEEAKRAEFLTGYRKMMAQLLVATGQLEIALLDNNLVEANRLVKDELLRLKKAGHDAYQGEEEH